MSFVADACIENIFCQSFAFPFTFFSFVLYYIGLIHSFVQCFLLNSLNFYDFKVLNLSLYGYCFWGPI